MGWFMLWCTVGFVVLSRYHLVDSGNIRMDWRWYTLLMMIAIILWPIVLITEKNYD